MASKGGVIEHAELESQIQKHRDSTAQGGDVNQAVESLLLIEKQLRLAADVVGTRMVVLAIVQICFQAKNWKALSENIILISKRRAQLKQAITAMVQEAMSYVEFAPDTETKVELIKALSNVTAGKIYVEIERARLTKKLAAIKESQGEVKEAASIMQDVAVETFGAMAKTEKIAFILEQVRLCLDHGDFMRAIILARKVNPRVFNEDASAKKKEGDTVVEPPAPDIPTLPELKLKFYELMIRYHKNARDYLEISRCYQAIYDTPAIKEDSSKWTPVLKKICWYLVLAPHGSMQSSLIVATAGDKKLQDLPTYKALLKQFTTWEVIQWSTFSEEHKAEIAEEAEIFGGEEGSKTLEDLRLRIIKQNILVVSRYYSRITLKRLGQLLDLSVEETEKHLSELVVSKAMYARIDRPLGIVTLKGKKDSNDVLNGWANNIEKLLNLVEKCCHHIHKETMVHKVALNA